MSALRLLRVELPAQDIDALYSCRSLTVTSGILDDQLRLRLRNENGTTEDTEDRRKKPVRFRI
jgi:hypothetical protein